MLRSRGVPHAVLALSLLAMSGTAAVSRYTVTRGDTLSAIAARNHTTEAALAAANHITDPNRIYLGQVLTIPATVAASTIPARAPSGTTTYIVAPGDTLSAIATRNHTTEAALAAANHITNPNRIYLGQVLTISSSAPAGAPAGKATTALPPTKLISSVRSAAGSGYYIVAPGDTVAGVAAAFGRSPVALAAANGVVNGMLYVGARLNVNVSAAGRPPVPAAPFVAQPPSTVTVVKGKKVTVPGKWICPVPGKVSFMNDWGFPREPGTWHEGNDLMAPRGTPVVAPVAGVLQRYPNGLGGNAFELLGSDGNRYYGAHLDSYGAAPGKVKAGTLIGRVGNTGDAEGGPTHLHFEIHPGGGDPVDPFPTVSLACR